jgi:ATP-dependent exoDNAse (exonuclease V) beta subunit
MSLVVYKSSAGSGKTTTLINEYLSLALKYPDRFGSIIALTFTIKATTEMKERVFKVLDRIIHLEDFRDDKGLESGLKHIMKATGFDESKIRIQAKVLLHNILHQYSDFAFSTIDSFVVRIVRSFAHDLNLSMDFNIELETDILVEQAIAMLFEKIGNDKKLTNFLIQYVLQNVENEKTLHIENDLAELGKIIFESRHYKSI